MESVTIGTVARQAGVGVETIRFYERRGLVGQPAKPSGAGQRRYAPETVLILLGAWSIYFGLFVEVPLA